MALSRWTDKRNKDFESIVTTIINFENWHNPEKDPITNEPLLLDIRKTFEDHQIIKINETEITYNLMKFEFEKVRPGSENETSRINRIQNINGFILVYTEGTQTQYVINRSNNSSTKTLLRKFTNAEKNLEIVSEPLNINEDLFVWMIYRVLNFHSDSLEEESELYLKKIIGFKGETADKLAEISGIGNRIMNQLSTLSFLFENEKVTRIKPYVEYGGETTEFSVDLNGNVIVDTEAYTGEHMMQDEDLMLCNLILLVFLEILPKIISSYHMSIKENEWNEEIKVKFFTDIGTSISKKIEEKMK